MDFASMFKVDGWTDDARGRFEGFACAFLRVSWILVHLGCPKTQQSSRFCSVFFD